MIERRNSIDGDLKILLEISFAFDNLRYQEFSLCSRTRLGGMRVVLHSDYGNNTELSEFTFRETGSEALRHRSHHPSPRP
jgi:hypothetical protein